MTEPRGWFLPTVRAVLLVIPAWLATGATGWAETPAAPSITLVGGRIVRPDGTLQPDTAVVVRDGKIRRLLPADKATGGAVRRFGAETVVCPGLIDLFSSLGTRGQSLRSLATVDPEVRASDALDSSDRHFRAALQAGITTAMVAPEPASLVAGTAVSFRTLAQNGRLDVLRDDGPLLFAFGPDVWRDDRPPTSRAGALHQLRSLLEETQPNAANARIRAALAGELDALLVCASAEDVRAVRSVLGDAADGWTIVHTADAWELAPDVEGHGRPLVVGPYTFASSRRALLGAARLAEAGIQPVFQGGFPATAPETLRISAAIATRCGLDPAAARRAMTSAAAEVAGIGGRVGSLTPGNDGDLVVFSGDPLRLDSHVLEVYICGRRVFAAADQDVSRSGGGL
jgi:imidazolonepropionase-like amidohydrolase